jgi:hypothetical protein
MSGDASTLNQDDEAAFAAGFDDDTTATPTETPAEQQDADALQEASTAPAAPAAPEYAQLTKAQLDDLLAIKTMQEKQFGTAFGKIGGIERTLQQLNSGAQVDISQEDIDALKDDFPPLAAALEKVRNLRALPGGGLDQEQLASLVAEKVSAVEQKFELRLLSKDHPDWKQIDADPAFAQWVAAQPDEFKQNLTQASQSYDSSVVSDAMSKFKQSRKAAPANPAADPASARRSRMSAAVTPRGTGGTAAGDSSDPFLSGFNSE